LTGPPGELGPDAISRKPIRHWIRPHEGALNRLPVSDQGGFMLRLRKSQISAKSSRRENGLAHLERRKTRFHLPSSFAGESAASAMIRRQEPVRDGFSERNWGLATPFRRSRRPGAARSSEVPRAMLPTIEPRTSRACLGSKSWSARGTPEIGVAKAQFFSANLPDGAPAADRMASKARQLSPA